MAASTALLPRMRRHGVVGGLNAEFALLVAAPASPAAMARWRVSVPGTGACADLTEVVALASRAHGDGVLLGLLRLARGGDDLAARVAFQACLGAVLAVARRSAHHHGGDAEEAESAALARLWELIGTYPLTRACRVLSGISLDVLHALTARDAVSAASHAGGCTGDLDGLATDTSPPPRHTDPLAPEGRADEDLLHLLAWAVRRGALAREDAALLWQVHSPADAAARGTAARDLGLSPSALRQRAHRAKQRLLAAVRDATATA